jgi:hypothetical protein
MEPGNVEFCRFFAALLDTQPTRFLVGHMYGLSISKRQEVSPDLAKGLFCPGLFYVISDQAFHAPAFDSVL